MDCRCCPGIDSGPFVSTQPLWLGSTNPPFVGSSVAQGAGAEDEELMTTDEALLDETMEKLVRES